jgi:hypothetical protein
MIGRKGLHAGGRSHRMAGPLYLIPSHRRAGLRPGSAFHSTRPASKEVCCEQGIPQAYVSFDRPLRRRRYLGAVSWHPLGRAKPGSFRLPCRDPTRSQTGQYLNLTLRFLVQSNCSHTSSMRTFSLTGTSAASARRPSTRRTRPDSFHTLATLAHSVPSTCSPHKLHTALSYSACQVVMSGSQTKGSCQTADRGVQRQIQPTAARATEGPRMEPGDDNARR